MKKNIKITLGISIFLAVIIASFFFINNATNLFAVTEQGVSTSIPSGCKSSILSIDAVSLSRSASDLGESVFQITLSGREGGQCIYGYLDSNVLEQKIGSVIGKTVDTKYSNPFLISLNRIETNAFYKINPSYEASLKKYRYTPYTSPLAQFSTSITCQTGSFSQSSCSKQCSNNGYAYSNCETPSWLVTITGCYCWDFGTDGYVYSFNGDRLQEKIDVTIATGDGGNSQVSLDTTSKTDSYSRSIRDGLYVTFEGFLQGTNILPSANAKVYSSGGTKKVINGNFLSSSQTPLCQNKISYKGIESCMMEYNNALNLGFSTPSAFSSANIEGEYVKLPLSKDTFYPIIKVQLKAKWLGIYEPVSEPDLINCQDATLNYRNTKDGYANYQLKIKEGTGSEGTFNIYSSCSDSYTSAVPTENTKTVTGTNIVDGKIRITQQVNKDFSSSCQIKASIERLGFSAQDTCSFKVIGTSSCSLESETCGSGCCEGLQCLSGVCRKQAGVEICYNQIDDDSNGLADCFDAKCKDSVYCAGKCETGETKCDDGVCRKDCGEGECKWYNIICKLKELFSTLGDILTIIKVLVLIIAVLFSLFFGKGILADIIGMDTTENKVVVWTIASLIAIGIGVGLYALLFTALFWIVSISAIIIFIILKFIPFRNLLK